MSDYCLVRRDQPRTDGKRRTRRRMELYVPTDLLPTMAIFLCFCCGGMVTSELVDGVSFKDDEVAVASKFCYGFVGKI